MAVDSSEQTHANFRTVPFDRFDDCIVNDGSQTGGGCLTSRGNLKTSAMKPAT